MKKISIALLIVTVSFFAFSNQKSGKKVARVKLSRGSSIVITPDGQTVNIKRGLWISEGSIIKTEAKSFVRLTFVDKSSMNIGPKSQLKIEKFSKKEAGVINILTGKIRSQVSKDYLQMEKGKSKLFIKSKNAVMGIRGTDFLFSTNAKTGATTAVLFEGSVVLNKLTKENYKQDLESIVNKGRSIRPGQFSVINKHMKRPTVPSMMSSRQIKALEKNKTFAGVSDKSRKKARKKLKAKAPPGLSGETVKSDKNRKSLRGIASSNNENKDRAKGFRKGHEIKPADGTMVDINTGAIIPMGGGEFDSRKGEWFSNTAGEIDTRTGDYIPPKGMEIGDNGNMVVLDASGEATGQVDIRYQAGLDPEDSKNMDALPLAPPPIQGPAPASDGFPVGPTPGEPIAPIDDHFDNEFKSEAENFQPLDIDGQVMEPMCGGRPCLPPPPRECSTCVAPKKQRLPPPPPPSHTNVKVNVQ